MSSYIVYYSMFLI